MATKPTRRGFFALFAAVLVPQGAAQTAYAQLLAEGNLSAQRAARFPQPPPLGPDERYWREYDGAGFRCFRATTRAVMRSREAYAGGMPREEAVRRLEAGEFDGPREA